MAGKKPAEKIASTFNDREINEDHANWLHRALGIPDYDLLPEKMVEKYWELKRIADRTGTYLTQREIVLIAWMLGYGKPTAKEELPPTVVDLYRKGQIKLEDPVQVKYRDKWMEGTLKSVTSNDELVIQPVGEPDERRFKTDDVRVAELAAV